MNINKIIELSQKPEIYTKGNAVMWTDEYISKQLLNVHLNTEFDLASRKKSSIELTINWILEQKSMPKLKILDLGCGPGLYAEILAKKGHQVTGIDFSKNSIQYAKQQAKEKNLNINYIQANYLVHELVENQFDLILLIYTDFGVLHPNEQEFLLQKVRKLLKPNGTFIFDVLNDKDIEKKTSPKNWEVANQGFWKPEPYLALSDSYLYDDEKVILYQHIVLDETEEVKIYRFWTHFFSNEKMKILIRKGGFYEFSFHDNILPKGDLWNGNNVTFCMIIK
jgi:2-polyprenyl-3-methyl-5-hydroxy-6-metoxy-1,4-benzoquinol methylase